MMRRRINYPAPPPSTLSDFQAATGHRWRQMYHMRSSRSNLLLLPCCLSGLATGLVPSLPSLRPSPRVFVASTINHLTMTTRTSFVDSCFGDEESSTSNICDANMQLSPSLNAKRPSSERNTPTLFQTLPTLMFLFLRRMALVPNFARALSSSTTSASLLPHSPVITIGRRRILSFFQSTLQSTMASLRKLNNTQRICLVFAAAAAGVAIEMIKAHRRQQIDATSEWGRYADRPALRGLALSLLITRLVPYIVLPGIIEKITGKSGGGDDDDGYDSREQHSSLFLRFIYLFIYFKPRELRTRGGKLFADGLLKLGPLYIKIGQILSCRKNLFPVEWILAMEKLQDRVPAKSGIEAWNLLYEACPGGKAGFHQRFTDFDDVPLAAASLGQVHKGRLRTGERVAIKIQRSRLRDIYDKDLALMKKIAKVVDSLGKAGQVGGVEQSWEGIFSDAETILYREIDYRDEADNSLRFAGDFGIGLGGTAIESTAKGLDGKKLPSSAEWMRIPYTYRDLSSEKFLVMEYVPSIKVSDNKKLDEAGVTAEDREYLAEALARSYLRQFCSNKFFSTDPHPGNLGVEILDDGLPRLVFYDFGQACSLADDQAVGILEVIESIIDSDAEKSVAAFSRMGVLKDNADLRKIQAKCQQNYDTGMLKVKKRRKRSSARHSQKSRTDTYDIDLEARLDASEKRLNETQTRAEDVNDAEIVGYFTLQSEYAFVARALSQLDGVGKGLDPEFDFISAAAPHLVEVKGVGRYLLDEMKKRLKFVYDPDDGILAKEMALFKSLGFDPNLTKK